MKGTTPILASEPISVKRIIFRIQSKNFSKLQFTLSSLLLFCASARIYLPGYSHTTKEEEKRQTCPSFVLSKIVFLS